jgi:predicted kinase
LLSSLLLANLVAQPILRLARAADSVRLSRARAISLPDIEALLGNRIEAREEVSFDAASAGLRARASRRATVPTWDEIMLGRRVER